MKFHVVIQDRSFSAILYPPGPKGNIKVESYSFRAIGGPYRATLSLEAAPEIIMSYIGCLRCPVTILDEMERVVWWGLINEITAKYGSVTVGASLSEMVNKVRVKYSLVTPGTFTPPQDTMTDFGLDLPSSQDYGIKEEVFQYHECSAEEAISVRDLTLSKKKYPIPHLSPASPNEANKITFYCSGWWDTLGWQYYANEKGLYSYTNGAGGKATVGDTPDSAALRQEFETNTNWTASTIKLKMMVEGAPTSVLNLFIYSPTSGWGVATIDAAHSPTELDWVECALITPLSIIAGETNKIQAQPAISGGCDATNFYWLALDTGYPPPSGFQEYDILTHTWVTRPKEVDGHAIFQITDRVESIQQIDDIISAKGQFQDSIIWDVAGSGVYSCQFRMGDRTALEEVEDLLKAGTTNDRRLLAFWDNLMVIHLLEEPTTIEYIYGKDGKVRNTAGALVPKYLCPCAQWMTIAEVLDWNVQTLASASPIFIEEAEYNVQGDTLSLTPRDMPNPLDKIVLAEPEV